MATEADLHILYDWQKDFWAFARDCFDMTWAQPIDSLRNKPITYTDINGKKRTTILFDIDGKPVYHDLSFYKKSMFKHQTPAAFKKHGHGQFTWQQTLTLTAYQRALETFGEDAFEVAARYISVASGHGTGKTASLSVISLHFITCFFGAQIGVTANTEDQLKDIFLKEFYFWHKRMPKGIGQEIVQLDDHIRVGNEKDWFLRARVGRKETPEALAGLHGEYVLIIADEASGIPDKVFEVMKGALTGDNYIVIYTSNPTRGEGEFYESHRPGSENVRLQFSSVDSPIVKDGFIQKMAADYGEDSEEYGIRVLGKFPDTTAMDDKGWIPLFANVEVIYEPKRKQLIKHPVIACDPAGSGRDSASVMARDSLYLREELHEAISEPRELAGKIRTIAEVYGAPMDDVAVEAFGIGAKVVANLDPGAHALLTDHAREENKLTEHDKRTDGSTLRFNSWKSELAWRFREWLKSGGIIITNNPNKWRRQLEKVKYRRDSQGRIQLMPKREFRKEYGFSPDEFDAAIHTFFKDTGTVPTTLSKAEIEQKEVEEWIRRAEERKRAGEKRVTHSSM